MIDRVFDLDLGEILWRAQKYGVDVEAITPEMLPEFDFKGDRYSPDHALAVVVESMITQKRVARIPPGNSKLRLQHRMDRD